MKLYYVETNGYDMIVGQHEKETRCFVYDGSLTDSVICYLYGEEKKAAALEVLNLIDPDCFYDWDERDAQGNFFDFNELTKDCEIVATIDIPERGKEQ